MRKVTFKIDKKLDFQNHLIGLNTYSKRPRVISPDFVAYYRKLRRVNKRQKFKIFKKRTKGFYSEDKKRMRSVIVRQIQEMWNLVEKTYIKRMEIIHGREFPYKKIYGILSTSDRFGYSVQSDKKWFACSNDSSVRSTDIAMHEIMHFFFHKYFYDEYKKKFSLTGNQIWTIKEAVTVILNSECRDIRFRKDTGHLGHEKLREKTLKDWQKYKNFEKVLDKACEYIKKNKLFLK